MRRFAHLWPPRYLGRATEAVHAPHCLPSRLLLRRRYRIATGPCRKAQWSRDAALASVHRAVPEARPADRARLGRAKSTASRGSPTRKGKRNVFTAVAPAFAPVRVTSFLKDDGIDLTGLRISDDGSTVVFVRGSAPNNDGWVANPAGDPTAPSARSGRRASAVPARGGSPKAQSRASRPTADPCST